MGGFSNHLSVLSPAAILYMERTMVVKVIWELKSVSRLKIFPEADLLWPIVYTHHKQPAAELSLL